MSKVLKATIKYSVKTLNDRSKVALGRSRSLSKTLFELKVKLTANLLPLIVSLVVLSAGIAYYYLNEPIGSYPPSELDTLQPTRPRISLYTAFVLALGIRNPVLKTDFSSLYQLCWPIFLEVVVFGLLTSVLLGNFNPKLMAKIHAKHRSNHVVVIGYSNLGRRIVDYLIKKRIPYVLVEQDESLVSDLINITEPVVVGDIKELSTLSAAQVAKCKEVFLLSEDFQSSVLACFHIRALNRNCPVYAQIFEEDDFSQYFAEELNVFPFSIWQWAKDSVREWFEKEDIEMKDVVIFGAKKLSQKISEYVAGEKGYNVHVVTKAVSERFLPNFSNVHFHEIPDELTSQETIEKSVDFQKVSHIFVTWKEREEVIKIAIFLKKRYPNAHLFIRVFDEVIGDVVRGLGAHDFSTSSFAFDMLQKQVKPTSAIYAATSVKETKKHLFSKRDPSLEKLSRALSQDHTYESKVSSPTMRTASVFDIRTIPKNEMLDRNTSGTRDDSALDYSGKKNKKKGE